VTPLIPRDAQRRGELETFAKKVGIVVATGIALLLLWRVRDVLILIFMAAVVASGISPAVRRVRIWGRFWFHRNISRAVAVFTVYFPFVLAVLLIAIVVVPRLVDETRALGAQLPMLLERNILTPLQRFMPVGPLREFLKGGVTLPRSSVFHYVRNTATVIASVVAVLFMIAYMLVDAHRLRNTILLLWPADVRADRRRMLDRMAQRMSSWLSGQLVLSGLMGLATFIGLLALRVPYALPLALLAMVGELVPVIGPIVGTAPALAVAILHSRWQFWAVLAMVILFQKLENLFVAPRVMARRVSISPLAAFIAFMIGAALLGIVGAIMAIPMAAIAHVAFEEAFVARRERRFDSDRAGTLLRRVD
jgi:predicted PurR-regulated permease PerM